MPRSVHIHSDYQPVVALALERNGFLTQGDLAAHLEIALSTVSNFFRGLNVSIAKFEQICDALGLDKQEIIKPQNANPASPLPQPAVSFFAYDDTWVGRDSLVTELVQKLNGMGRLLALVGIAGIGKTALAERLFVEMQQQAHIRSDRLIRENFDEHEKSADFASFAIRLLERCGEPLSLEDRQDVSRLRRRLVQHLCHHRYWVVIDSLEEILKGNETEGWSEFKDANFVEFFQGLLAAESCQSRILLTSQELPTQLVSIGHRYPNFWFCQPLSGLTASEQLDLFDRTGLAVDDLAMGKPYLKRIGSAYEGHPLALRVIAGEIGSRPFYGNVIAYWHRYGCEIEVVEQAIADAQTEQLTGADDRWQLDRFTRTLRRSVRSRLEKTLTRLKADAPAAYTLLCEASIYRCPVPEAWWFSHLDYWNYGNLEQQIALDVLSDRYLVEQVVDEEQALLRQHHLIRSISLDHLKQLEASHDT